MTEISGAGAPTADVQASGGVVGALKAIHILQPWLGAVCVVVAAVVIVLRHPYRRELRAYAHAHHVSTTPSVGQLVPLMVWWALLMAAVVFTFPVWGSFLVWLVLFGAASLLLPHIDGSRRLAYA